MGIGIYGNEEILSILKSQGFDARLITAFSDTELNTEVTRRYHEAKKRYEEMMAQGLV